MAAKINIKNMDYFKYRKLVIDGNRDDYNSCSREVKMLCDCVETLAFRDDEFDDQADRTRFDEVCSYYKQILASKRIEPIDMRLKSGWWGDPSKTQTGYSAGKIKQTVLLEVLVNKTRDWMSRHSITDTAGGQGLEEKLEGPGLYVFKHREKACFQLVGRAENVFVRCAERLKTSFDGSLCDPLAALLVVSLASDWDFYFVSVATTDGERIVRIIENDLILKHDCIWPHGLNFSLHMDSLLEVSEFRRSCLRHHWPPEYDTAAKEEAELDLSRLRRQLLVSVPTTGTTAGTTGTSDFEQQQSGCKSRPVSVTTKSDHTQSTVVTKTTAKQHKPVTSSTNIDSSKTTINNSSRSPTKPNKQIKQSQVSQPQTDSGGATDGRKLVESSTSQPPTTTTIVGLGLTTNDTAEETKETSCSDEPQTQCTLKRSGTFTALPAAVDAETDHPDNS